MPIGLYRRGADIVIELDVLTGTLAGTFTAGLMRATSESVGALRGALIPMVVTARATSGDLPAGFTLTLSAEQSATLTPSFYAVDLKVVDAVGGVSITDKPAFIQLLPAVI